MLCTLGIHTANNKMTPLHKLLGLTIFGLVLQRGLSINVPVGDQVESESHSQQHYQPTSNGKSRYQIYEIHNHYVSPPSSPQRLNHYQSYARPPVKQQIRIEHVNAPPLPPASAQYAPHLEDINISFLSFAAAEGPNGQQITVNEPVPSHQSQVGAKYLAPIRQKAEYVPDYRAQIPERQHLTAHHHHQAQQVGSPQHFDNSAAQYVAAAHHGAAQQVYKGPDYLPPLPPKSVQQVNFLPPLQSPAVETKPSAEQSHAQYNTYNGYGNGCGEHNCQSYSQQVVAQTAPQDAGIVTQQNNPQQYQSFAVSADYQVSDPLPSHAAASGPTSNSASDYLPPQRNPEVRHTSDQAPQPQYVQHNAPLPSHAAASGPTSNSASDYLPPQRNPEVRHTSDQAPQHLAQTLQPQYVQHNAPQLPQSNSQQQQQRQQQKVLSPNDFIALPAGYEFEKPANVEQAFAELHSQQIQQQKQAALAHQQQQRASYSSYLEQKQLLNHALSHQQPQQQQNQQQHTPQYMQPAPYYAPDYLPPVAREAAAVAAAPQQNYHQEPQMYSLNSYMTSVQPNERYGNPSFSTAAAVPRKPFAQYGTPAVQQSLQVAQMYSEPATRPVAYASAMPYKTNAVPQDYTTFTLSGSQRSQKQLALQINEQTRQSLQSLMPKDIQEQQIASSGTGKVRTVQILNSSVIKTLKVLETQDSAGVKTIKILGDSNESPIGSHQTVRVVSSSKDDAQQENVQTVKIFNDHKDVQLDAGGSTAADAATVSDNAYLPPSSEAEKKRAVRDSREAHALPQQFGRQS